jgi:hypothetical protein
MSTAVLQFAQTTFLISKSVSLHTNTNTISVVENELDLLSDHKPFFHPKYTHQVRKPLHRLNFIDLQF